MAKLTPERVRWAVAPLCILTLCGCYDSPYPPPNGVSKTEKRSVAPFTSVETVSGDIELVVGEPTGVEVTFDENYLKYVSTRVEGGKLLVTAGANDKAGLGLKVKITAPEITAIRTNTNLTAAGLNGEQLAVTLAGQNVNVKLSGKVGTLTLDSVHATGSRLDARALSTNSVNFNLAGVSVELGSVETLDGVLYETTVFFDGSPRILVDKRDSKVKIEPRSR